MLLRPTYEGTTAEQERPPSLAAQQVMDSIRMVPGSTCLAVPVATREGPSKPG